MECKIFMEFSKTVATLPDKECPGLKPAETELCVTRPSCEGAGTREMMADQVLARACNEPSRRFHNHGEGKDSFTADLLLTSY